MKELTNTFITSDLHFGHENCIKYSKRPFLDVNDMNEQFISNWNKVIKGNDEVYVLGDMVWKNPNWMKTILDRLEGKIYLVKGGHDRSSILRKVAYRFEWVKDYTEMDYVSKRDGKLYSFIMMHYPLASWHRSHYGSIHTYGHCHQNRKSIGKSIDVGIDNPLCNYTPFNIEYIIELMNQIPTYIDHAEREKEEAGN